VQLLMLTFVGGILAAGLRTKSVTQRTVQATPA
jgi:hypothetical protein